MLNLQPPISHTVLFQNICLSSHGRLILNNVSGFANRGQLFAIMGPSGCGKTSLLNFLAFRQELSGVPVTGMKGAVLLEGIPIKNSDKKRIGYVMQNDLFFEKFTVSETMAFYADIYLPSDMKPSSKKERVISILKSLDLLHTTNTIIGGGLTRGISGGERKRLSIAVELLTDPDILILDEPTSGLDSGMAMQLIEILKNLAKEQSKAIIMSIHQPSSQAFFMFDNLLLLSNGEVIYFGPVDEIHAFCNKINLECPENWNIADHLISITNISDLHLKESYRYSMEIIDHAPSELNIVPQPFDQSYKSSYFTQFKALTRRSFKYTARETYNLFNFLTLVIMSLLIGLVFYQTPFTIDNLDNALGLVFYISLQTVLDPIYTSILQFSSEFTIIRKERMSKSYHFSAYYFGKISSDIFIVLLRPTILYVIVYFMGGMSVSWYFIPSLFTMYLTTFLAHAIGLLIGSLGLSYYESVKIASIYVTFSVLIGGFYNKKVHKFLKWTRYLSPVYYSYVMQIWIQLISKDVIPCHTSDPSTLNPNIVQSCNSNNNKLLINDLFPYIGLEIPPIYYFAITSCSSVIIYFITFLTLRRSLSLPNNAESLIKRIYSKLKTKTHKTM